MQISILTLFPEMFSGPFDYSILQRAREKKLISIDLVNIRDFALDRYQSVDEHPYGGGAGMILRVDVVDRALQSVKQKSKATRQKVILLDPQGTAYTQKMAQKLSLLDHLILLSGHYEGVDHRIRTLVDSEISIGDYILTGGEIPAMVIVDSVVRLIPGVLTKREATRLESFSRAPLLEYPQYTKPTSYQGLKVPEILLSGNHAKIDEWRLREANRRTKTRRPDLIRKSKNFS